MEIRRWLDRIRDRRIWYPEMLGVKRQSNPKDSILHYGLDSGIQFKRLQNRNKCFYFGFGESRGDANASGHTEFEKPLRQSHVYSNLCFSLPLILLSISMSVPSFNNFSLVFHFDNFIKLNFLSFFLSKNYLSLLFFFLELKSVSKKTR